MSDNLGKKLKFIAVAIGVLGAVACFAMAFGFFKEENLFYACAWLIFAILSLLLIIPLYSLGNIADALADTGKKLRTVADKTAKLEKRSPSDTGSVDKYSPSIRVRSGTPEPRLRTTQTEAMGITTAERKVASPVAKSTGELTREFSVSKGTIEINNPNQSMGTMTSAFNPPERIDTDNLITGDKPSSGEVAMSAFYTTSSIDTFRVNRRGNSVTRFLAPASAASISAGGLHTVAVTEGGSVLSAGYGTYGQCNVGTWNSIVAVAAGNHHTIGLKSDGTCLATGYSGYGQCDVSAWRNICAVSAGVGHTVGLLENGTCVAAGDNTYGQCNVSDWVDIIAISAGYNYTVGLRADGTIVAVGANTDGQWGAIRWGSICAVASGGLHTIGLRGDGTCVAVGNNANDQCEVSRWQNIRAIAAGNYHTVGLLADGKVTATGYNGYGQCNVSGWENIAAVSAGRNHTIALTRSGLVLAVGDNTYGQCDTKAFRNIRVIK